MRIDNCTVLVTGGAGFIGSNLVDRLLTRGCSVRVLDDLSTGSRENLGDAVAAGAELIEGSVLDEDAVRRAAADCDVVMHLAASNLRVSLTDPWPSHDVNAGGTLTVCRALIGSGVSRVLCCSSSEAYGSALTTPMTEEHPARPTTVYGASKLAAEWYALAHLETDGLPVVVARPFNTYGFREHVLGASGEVIPKMTLRALAGRPPVIFGDGLQTRDFTFVTDTADGLIAACEADDLVGTCVNVGFGREVSITDVAALVCRAAGSGVGPVHRSARPADVRRHYADVTRLHAHTGWRAAVAVEEGIERYVEWFRDRHGHELDRMLAVERERNWEPAPGP